MVVEPQGQVVLVMPVIMELETVAVVVEAHLVVQPQEQAELVARQAAEVAVAVVLILGQAAHQARAEMVQLEYIVGR